MSEPEIQEEGLNSNEGSEETAYQVKRDSSSPDFQWTKPIVPENKNNKKQSFTMIEEAFVSTKEGNFEKVKELLDKGFDLTSKNAEGKTILHIASIMNTENHLNIVSYIVDHFPYAVHLVDQNGESALHESVRHLNLDAVVLLLKGGSVVNLLSKSNVMPLDLSPPLRNIILEHVKTPPIWIPDSQTTTCQICETNFTVVQRRHHCRHCGRVLCSHCANSFLPILKFKITQKVRLCVQCKPLISTNNSTKFHLNY